MAQYVSAPGELVQSPNMHEMSIQWVRVKMVLQSTRAVKFSLLYNMPRTAEWGRPILLWIIIRTYFSLYYFFALFHCIISLHMKNIKWLSKSNEISTIKKKKGTTWLGNSCVHSNPVFHKETDNCVIKASDYRYNFWVATLLNWSFVKAGTLSFIPVTPTPDKILALDKYLLNEWIIYGLF